MDVAIDDESSANSGWRKKRNKEPGIYKKEKKHEGQSYSECGIVWELKKQFVFHLNIKRQNGWKMCQYL